LKPRLTYTASLLILGLLGVLPCFAEEEAVKLAAHTDWVPDPPEVNVCRGHYALPHFPAQPSLEIEMHADESFFVLGSGESELKGRVLIEEPGRRLFADKVIVLRDAEGNAVQASAIGGILIETPEYRIWGDQATVFLSNNDTTLWNAEYRWYARQGRGEAKEAHTADNEPLVLYKASFTTCAPDDNLWMLKSEKVVLNKETGRGSSWNTRLLMKDIPVLYVPYLNFPIDNRRQTGFLTPEFRTSTINGASIRTPYYLNLAPNYDATLYPYYMDDRGLQIGGEYRFLLDQFNGHLYGEYLNEDRAFAHFRERKLASTRAPDPSDPRRSNLENDSADRWMANLLINGSHGPHWKTYFEFLEVSDDEYLIDFGNNTFGDDERQLRRRAELMYSGSEVAGTVYVQDYQTLQPFEANLVNPPYRMLPSAQAFYTPYTPDYPFVFSAGGQFTAFRHSFDALLGETPTFGNRYHLAPTLSFPMRRPYGFINPSVTLMETYYDLSLSNSQKALEFPNTDNRAIPITSLDAGLTFERVTTVFNHSYVQTLEPRLFYLYTPYVNQNKIPNFDTAYFEFTTSQLFRINRFSGFDRIADANQVSLALTSRYYDESLGDQRFNATVGQIYYFDNQRVMLCNTDLDPNCYQFENPTARIHTSPVVADTLYRFDPRWYFTADARFDTSDSKADLFSGRLHYQTQPRDIIHLGLRYEESGNELGYLYLGEHSKDLLQSDLGLAWGVTPELTVLGRWYYDIRNRFNVDAFGGLEYENCCYAIRLGARRYLMINSGDASTRQFDTEIFFQWIFKGLGGVGRSPVDYFTTSLPGYQDRFEVEI
jgi:LPS-assembly protein